MLFLLIIFKKLGLIDNKVYYESHKLSKFLIGTFKYADGIIVVNNHLKSIYKEKGLENVFAAQVPGCLCTAWLLLGPTALT